jgi:hypothetical protein
MWSNWVNEMLVEQGAFEPLSRRDGKGHIHPGKGLCRGAVHGLKRYAMTVWELPGKNE